MEQYKYLELIITDKLTWGAHIANIHGKIAPFLGTRRRCRHMLNENGKYLIYNSFIKPHFRYIKACYGYSSVGELKQLQRLQNKAI